MYLLDLLEGRRANRQSDLARAERLEMIGLIMVTLISYSRVVSVVLVLWGVAPILWNGYRT